MPSSVPSPRITSWHGILLPSGGHGNRETLNLGRPGWREKVRARIAIEEYDHLYLDITDGEQFERMGSFLAPGATIVLVSCSTGKGGDEDENLATVMHAAIPHTRLHAPMVGTGLRRISVTRRGKVRDVRYHCKRDQTLVLEPTSSEAPARAR